MKRILEIATMTDKARRQSTCDTGAVVAMNLLGNSYRRKNHINLTIYYK